MYWRRETAGSSSAWPRATQHVWATTHNWGENVAERVAERKADKVPDEVPDKRSRRRARWLVRGVVDDARLVIHVRGEVAVELAVLVLRVVGLVEEAELDGRQRSHERRSR